MGGALSYYAVRVAKDQHEREGEGIATDETVSADRAAGCGPRAAGSVEESAPSFGAKIGRFQVVKEIGAGGMGVVVAALDPLLDRMVAVKLLRAEAFGEDATEKARTRLLREAQAMAKLSHPNVLPVFDAGQVGDEVFIAMELVEGGNLGEWLKEEKRSWREVLDVFLEAGRGLAAAHRAGLVHRDFKPANVLVSRRGHVRVADFGLVGTSSGVLSAQSLTKAGKATFGSGSSVDETLTHTGTLLGTPRYMAPEQHLGEDTDARADQFAYCVALYHALYGRAPFAGDTHAALAANVLDGNLRRPPASADVPAWIGDVVVRGLSRERDDRYPSMAALLADLVRDPTAKRRRSFAVAGLAAVILGLVAALVLVVMRSGSEDKGPCAEVASELAGVWDEDVKADVERALLASGRLHARESYDRVVKLVDTYAGEWVALRTQTCEAANKSGEQADQLAQLRSVCLAQRRDELEAVTALLAEEPDGQVADKAIVFALELAPLDACTGESAVPVMIPPPDRPGLRERVSALRKDLARAKALRLAGKLPAGGEIVRKVLAEARALDYAPIEAEALLELHYQKRSNWQFDAAKAALREAVIVAERGRHDVAAALARIGMLESPPFDREAVDALRREAEAAIERAGGDKRLQAVYLDTVSGALFKGGRTDEALQAVERALGLYERTLPADHPMIPLLLNTLGGWLMNVGRADEARPYLERALATYERTFGANHPELANTLDTMGWLHLTRAEYERAHSYFERARSGYEESLGLEHPRPSHVFFALTYVRLRQGKPAEARREADRWFAHLERSGKNTASAVSSLGWADLLEGKYDQALENCAKASAIEKEQELLESASIPLCLGTAYLGLGDPTRAIEPLERALDAWKPNPMIPLMHRPSLRFTLARALWDAKRDQKRALELAEQALEELEDLRAHGYKDLQGELAEVEQWLRVKRG